MFMTIENLQKTNLPNREKSREMIEKEIQKKLKLYHTTTKEKWEKIQEVGAILSERELVKRGLITTTQLDDFETTSTGHMDREENRDDYVFASHQKENYGDVTLEINLEALNIPEAKVSTAGEWLMFADTEEAKQYYRDQEIPASQFISYLTEFLQTLPDTEWFWGIQNKEVRDFFGQAMKDRAYNNNDEKFRTFWKLHPEIIFPKELPLKYIKQAIIDEQ
jgi:hypothetical protein